jgi:hypothetical protein
VGRYATDADTRDVLSTKVFPMYGTTIMLTALLRAGRFGGVRPPV